MQQQDVFFLLEGIGQNSSTTTSCHLYRNTRVHKVVARETSRKIVDDALHIIIIVYERLLVQIGPRLRIFSK